MIDLLSALPSDEQLSSVPLWSRVCTHHFSANWVCLVVDEDVVVMNSATVKDLKLAIKKKVNDTEQSSMGHRQISW